MDGQLRFKPLAISSLLLMIVGWGGLYYIVFYTLPLVWPRWGFFVFSLMAVTGTLLPIVYFFHRRFPGEPPAEANVAPTRISKSSRRAISSSGCRNTISSCR